MATDDIASVVEQINRHTKEDESVSDILAIGKGLVRLFGYYNKRRKIDIPAKIEMNKKRYPELGLKIKYGWAKRLMKVAMDDKINDPSVRHCLPAKRNCLEQCARMSEKKFYTGIKPDPTRRKEIFIHPNAKYYDLVAYRKEEETIKPKYHKWVVVLIPSKEAEWDDVVDEQFRSFAHTNGFDYAIADVVKNKKKEHVFETGINQDIEMTLSIDHIDKAPKEEDEN